MTESHDISKPQNATPINYIEFEVADIAETKRFYAALFGWAYEDYGDSYTAFNDGHLDGGFALSESPKTGGPIVIFYAADLEAMLSRVQAENATITAAIFPFPGGRRFQFLDPTGHELAVWSDK
ncbi:MAG: VOC family protein [Candidatus Poribacteria bacterium]|nr:VOC family protein [Candidatus Poribacteria bacterium]